MALLINFLVYHVLKGSVARKMVKMYRRDIVRAYVLKKQFIEKLRRLADCLEKDEVFRIQIAESALLFLPMPSSILSTRGKAGRVKSSFNYSGRLLNIRDSTI